VRVEVEADTETPVSAFLKLSRGKRQAFLLESVEGGERSGRFSFLGAGPRTSMTWRLGQAGDPVACDLCQPKIKYLCSPILREYDVCRFDVPVNNPRLVSLR